VLPCYLNGDTVIVPKEHAHAIANAPDSELDPYPVADEYMQEDYTLTIRPNEAIIIETIRKHLTGKSLEAMFPTIQEEVPETPSYNPSIAGSDIFGPRLKPASTTLGA